MTLHPAFRLAATAAALAFAATGLHAQTALNQSKATFPIKITQPGSYKLTSNLVVSAPNVTAIAVYASDVTIDLNGFQIVGPVVCSGMTVTCTSNGDGYGVAAYGAVDTITVRNGTIRGFSAGVLLGTRSRVEDLNAINNSGYGISVYSGSTVARVNASRNMQAGVTATHSAVTDSVAEDNAGSGFYIAGGLLTRSVAQNNKQAGLRFNDLEANQKAAYGQNVFTFNTVAIQGAGGFSLGQNMCSGAGC